MRTLTRSSTISAAGKLGLLAVAVLAASVLGGPSPSPAGAAVGNAPACRAAWPYPSGACGEAAPERRVRVIAIGALDPRPR